MRLNGLRVMALSALIACGAALMPALDVAATAAPGRAPTPAHHQQAPVTPELTVQLRDLFVAQSQFGIFDRLRVGALLARPTQGMADPEGDGYDEGSTKLCGKRICVHYVTTGSDAAAPTQVHRTLRVMEAVWRHEVGALGFRRPPSDGKKGGDARFDVYLSDLGSRGLFGYCTPESRVGTTGYAAAGYCVLDNDFARRQYHAGPKVALEVTAAHEFFHAIQFGYDYRADPWLMESTAVWMEESFADSANDNRRYLPYGDVHQPWHSLDEYSDTGYAQYGNWPFWQYLTDRYGAGLVRKVWNHVDTTRNGPAQASVPALKSVLGRKLHSSDGLARTLTRFATANLTPASSYREGRAWPRPTYSSRARMRMPHGMRVTHLRVAHLAARDAIFRPPTSGHERRLRLTITAPRARAAVVVSTKWADGTVTHRTVRLKAGQGRVVTGFSPRKVGWVIVTAVNTSARYTCDRGTLLSCGGTPKDDGKRFAITARVVAMPRNRSRRP